MDGMAAVRVDDQAGVGNQILKDQLRLVRREVVPTSRQEQGRDGDAAEFVR